METHHEPLDRREFLKRAAKATTAMAAFAGMDSAVALLIARGGEPGRPGASRISYFCNGEIHVNEPIQCQLGAQGQLHRVSISPSEKKVCFEFLRGQNFTEPGHTLYIADFDAQKPRMTNFKAIANEAGKMVWFAYPRWIDGEAAVVYHFGETGKNQLYVYRLEEGSTRRVSTNAGADLLGGRRVEAGAHLHAHRGGTSRLSLSLPGSAHLGGAVP